jgi:hypothetical protein
VRWSDEPLLAAILLNPSTATENKLDPTLRRVKGFAERDGYGGMLVANLFALRSTDRSALIRHVSPIGLHNDEAIDLVALNRLVGRVVVGWGVPHKKWIPRALDVERRLLEYGVHLWCFGEQTAGGWPRHPLYLPKSTQITQYRIGRRT